MEKKAFIQSYLAYFEGLKDDLDSIQYQSFFLL